MSQATKIEERLCHALSWKATRIKSCFIFFSFSVSKKMQLLKTTVSSRCIIYRLLLYSKKNSPKRTHHKSSTALQDAKAMASTFRHLRGHVGRRAKAATKEPRHLDLSVIRKEGFGMFGRMVCLRSLENHHFWGHERIKSYSNHIQIIW